ncbi:MAG TPA: VCBS domain-containing protein [Gemmatimonadaceae bacterium]|nr:VCBS domain-containing protein [Gemmatimonadaceae bacterium]
MKRFSTLLALVFLAACTNEPTAVDSRLTAKTPVFTVGGSNAGGVTFATGSGCSVVLSHFECNYTVDGASGEFSISERGQWSYTYRCVHKKSGKESTKYPITIGSIGVTNLFSVTAVSGQIVQSNKVLAPSAPTDCAANKGAFTTTALRSNFIPASWSLFAQKSADPSNYFASLFETL